LTLPGLRDLFDQLARQRAFQSLLASLRKPAPADVRLSGLNASAQAIYAGLLERLCDRPLIVATPNSAAAEAFVETAGAVFELLEDSARRAAPCLLPAHDVTPYDGLSPHADINEKRAVALGRLADGSASIVVASVASLLLKTPSAESVKNLVWAVEVGDEFFLEDLEQGLRSVGYSRCEPVEMVGQYSIRGGLLDVFYPEAPLPVRIEMFGDEIESIREFDPETQKSVQRIDRAALLPLSDYPSGLAADEPSLAPGWEFSRKPRTGCALELPRAPIIIWIEPEAIAAEAAKRLEKVEEARSQSGSDEPVERWLFSLDELREKAASRDQTAWDQLGVGADEATLEIRSQRTPRFQGDITHAVRELKAQVGGGKRALVASSSVGDIERFADVFNEYGVSYQLAVKQESAGLSPYLEEKAYLAGPVASVVVAKAAIRDGVVFPDANILIYGSEDFFATSELVARPEKKRSAASAFLSDLEDLKEGDFVVHAEHGVGRYRGMTAVKQGERQEDLMLIEYADRAKLYLPLSRLDLIQKYHGAGGPPPALDRMGGQTWQRTKSRVRAKLVDMADDLLKLYAERKMAKGFSFSPDSNWQREFEDSFPYTPTADQLKSVTEIKRDMESTQTLDRLVCGDVGFGKTEVAMRAAFKALGDEKQVAVLAPTTVLSFQHHETFRERFRAFPVEIEMLNRFRTPKQQKEILERVAQGKVDVLVGTHRLLSKDVEFNDLGLLIVDEEQRFGVRHKERLKQIKRNVDVLTLTATPIPRTLHMSLVGLRDVSIIQTPPKDRLAIHTVVAPFSEQLVRTAVEQELSRGGQVYFIHNRVESIWAIAAKIQELVPGARVGVGHGQLPERQLEKVMLKFMRREFDVLVATTIVENGLDIPRANTILINRAENYGLSELYQLRGRVGRSDRRAYAYLLIPEDKELTDVARKRLAALKEFSELGSGFKIAALDLELRGAGNLLGAEQSGQIAAVGFDTYCRMLDETIRKLQGETVEDAVRVNLKLQLDIHIPTEYISDEAQRLRAYKQLAAVATQEDRAKAEAELRDRYGAPPEEILNLLDYSLLKSRAEALRVESAERRAGRLQMRFREDSKIDPERLMRFVATTQGVTFSPSGELIWNNFQARGRATLAALSDALDRIAA